MVSVQCQSDMRGSVKGVGEVVKQEINLAPIHGVDLGFSGDVILTQGSPQKIVLEGQQNILDIIKRDVDNGVWKIHFDRNTGEMKNVTVHITLPNIDDVKVSGSGSIRSTNRFTGTGNMEINVSGSGAISLDYVANTTDVDLSGSGKINLSGESKDLSVTISGSGDVSAADLKTDDCEIHINGSGDANVNVDKNLDGHINGSGDIRYAGNPSVDTRVNGSGGVSKMN